MVSKRKKLNLGTAARRMDLFFFNCSRRSSSQKRMTYQGSILNEDRGGTCDSVSSNGVSFHQAKRVVLDITSIVYTVGILLTRAHYVGLSTQRSICLKFNRLWHSLRDDREVGCNGEDLRVMSALSVYMSAFIPSPMHLPKA